jgi:hypothetical protein
MDLGTNRSFPDPLEERPNNADIDIGFEKSKPDLTQCRVNARFIEASATAQPVENDFKATRDLFEHQAGEGNRGPV